MTPVVPPWTVRLTQAEHDLVLFMLVGAALTLFATLVRVRFTSRESYGGFRSASLTANAVVALALAAYIGLIAAFLVGYREQAGLYVPLPAARFAWELRFMDWVVTVPLLVLELTAVSALSSRSAAAVRRFGMVAAATMIVCGFLGAFIVEGGRNLLTYTLFGVGGAVCFVVLYALFFGTMLRSLPRIPEQARRPYRAAVVLLLITWLAYPIVYGFLGVLTGGAVVVLAQVLLSTADLVAKVGFGVLVHRAAVLRSRAEDDLDPNVVRRPRAPVNDSVYVADARSVGFDAD